MKQLRFCANLTTMFTSETKCLPERYDLAKKAGFKAVEIAFPYEFEPQLMKEKKEASGLEQVRDLSRSRFHDNLLNQFLSIAAGPS